jgi:hypothetical protein
MGFPLLCRIGNTICNTPQVCEETVERCNFRPTRPFLRHGRREQGEAGKTALAAGRLRGGMVVACAYVRIRSALAESGERATTVQGGA